MQLIEMTTNESWSPAWFCYKATYLDPCMYSDKNAITHTNCYFVFQHKPKRKLLQPLVDIS